MSDDDDGVLSLSQHPDEFVKVATLNAALATTELRILKAMRPKWETWWTAAGVLVAIFSGAYALIVQPMKDDIGLHSQRIGEIRSDLDAIKGVTSRNADDIQDLKSRDKFRDGMLIQPNN